MNRRLSVYLDLLRLLAAFMVFAAHSIFLLTPGLRSHTVGAEAVIVFFVLSGFVISFVTSTKERDWRAYAAARASRMYTVVPLAILVTIVADQIGMRLAPHWYVTQAPPGFNLHSGPVEVLRYVSFTNELWFSHAVVGSNEPNWSLGFEVPYYLLFGMVMFIRSGPVRLIAAILWSALHGPHIALFLPLWLIGVVTHRLMLAGVTIPARAAAAVAIGAAVVAVIVDHVASVRWEAMQTWIGWRGELKMATCAYVLAALLGCHILAVNSLPDRWTLFGPRRTRWIRWLAGGSFTLYIMHLPILSCLTALVGAPSASHASELLVALAAIVSCYLLAELGERRKKELTRALARVVIR